VRIEPIELKGRPGEVLAAWPSDWPLAALWSGDDAPGSRWTVLARPGEVWRGVSPCGSMVPFPAAAREGERSPNGLGGEPPFAAGWIGYLSYDLGAALEPRAVHHGRAARAEPAWPLMEWHRVDEALIYDHSRGRWWSVGGLAVRGPTVAAIVGGGGAPVYSMSRLRSAMGKAGYLRRASRVLEYIRAGDVYQVNLAHELRGGFSGSSRALFAALTALSRPWFGAYLESRDERGARALLSLSPEMFLEFDPGSRRVRTRPMKGTRPGAASAEELESSVKDRAELAMIVDLMRNDLGRVCEFGTVRVDAAREIERHGGRRGVLQATGAASGTLRAGLTIDDLLRATFPGGSVTGAPKVRAMQIIDELEPAARGPYCGAVGFISDSGHAAFNIAIRTALIEGGAGAAPGEFDHATLRYSVGAGIVADSDAESEWRETLDKARGMGAAFAMKPVAVGRRALTR